jgi:1,4-dihydroxy-2-naphthoate polyprenyltransferase
MKKIVYLLKSTRPKTLPASIIPVLIASSLAYSEGYFKTELFIIILICALLIQITTNFINEIYDFKRGADTKERLGPERAVASGKISSIYMRNAALTIIFITFCLGLILVYHAGYLILLIGVVSLFFAYAYTGGPFPLAYKGLGDIFVFIFFGLVAVSGTYYIYTKAFSTLVLILSMPPGFLASNILAVNNIRDIETDKKAGKFTLAVRIGKSKSQIIYVLLNILTFLNPVLVFIFTGSCWNLLPLTLVPLSVKICIDIYHKNGRELNSVLAGAGLLLFLYGILNSVGLLLIKY